MFQHTAARRRLGGCRQLLDRLMVVSTHSRPKAAGLSRAVADATGWFQHTAARRRLDHNSGNGCGHNDVSTHSRPKAAGAHARHAACGLGVSTHSRPKAAGACLRPPRRQNLFQHTAARRRLGPRPLGRLLADAVSTHSRPKAAGDPSAIIVGGYQSFNTQPPEGGWITKDYSYRLFVSFNTQPPEGGWMTGQVMCK